jgi:hypothetical protein
VVEYLLRSTVRVGFSWCLAAAALFAAGRADAQEFGYVPYGYGGWSSVYGLGSYGGGGPDPNYFRPAAGAYPDVYSTYNWQMNPFAVGYDLLAGYRPIYGGARQPVGHEMIWTSHNGYVYRPTYSPNTTSTRVAWGGGPLVIDFPGTDRAKYYTSSGRVWEAPLGETRPGMFTANDVAPPIPLDAPAKPTSGAPREF